MSRKRQHKNAPANLFEFFPTPPPFTRYLFDDMRRRGHEIKGAIYEPCVGDGAIVTEANAASGYTIKRWLKNDLDPQWEKYHDPLGNLGDCTTLDATDEETWRGLDIDWTISNPPFTLAIEIIELALRYSRVGVAMHVRCTLNEPLKTTGLRQSFLREHPPTGTLWLPRYSYRRTGAGKRSTDSAPCVWLIWLKRPPLGYGFTGYAPPDVIDAAIKYRRQALPLFGVTE